MKYPTGIILFLLGLLRFLRAEDCTTGFSVVAPELGVAGKTTAVLVTLHGPSIDQPINVTLILLPPRSAGVYPIPLVTSTQEIKGHGILPLTVPSGLAGTFTLQTLVNCSGNEQDECVLKSTSHLRLVGPVREVIIRPARHAYRPGDTVSFWVLALDQDLQIAKEVIGTVSVKDPAGTTVAFWDQIPLHEGVKDFSLPLSKYVHGGKWLLHVEVEAIEFSAPIEVMLGAGRDLPDFSTAEEHYVELRFGRDMRRRYKPGLPFSGKVEAVSTENSVRVRVKVYDNTTSIYSQDIEITNGEGTFLVPAIMADSDVIVLQAELVSVESKEIESHYVLAREPIHKWNSSSNCYLLIEGVEHTLQLEEEAQVTILSTCPCERDLHYVITTGGTVTDWAQRRYDDNVFPKSTSNESICKLNFSFIVRSAMAPVSQLLVYYVTPQGEPISDVINFDVKLLQRQVYIMMEDKEWWEPNQSIDLEVIAEPSSLICLLGGRSGGSNEIKFDPRISEERIPTNTITGEVDFLEAGVSFFQRQCIKHDTGMSATSYKQRWFGAGPVSNRRHPPESLVGGTAFDQLWLWKCFNYTSNVASSPLTIAGPPETGKWSIWALTISNSEGLKFTSPVTVNVFKPLQIDFHLPPTLRVRETLEVDIKIANKINTCMDITALLSLNEGAQFMSNGLLYVSERLRLGPHGATSLVVRLLVTTAGLKNLTVEVNGYSSASCEGTEREHNSTLVGAVVKSATVLVNPEGIIKTETESAYFCANENMLTSSADSYEFKWIGAPRNKDSILLELKAGNSKRVGPVYIALAQTHYPIDRMYRITIGDTDNTISWIGRGVHEYGVHLASAKTPNVLSQDEWQTYWITWEKNIIAFGRGSIVNVDTILKWKMDKQIKIQQIGFASSWGSLVEFRIWNFNEESGFSQVLHLDTPRSVVPGSEYGELLVAGGLPLPSFPSIKHHMSGGLSDTLSSLTNLMALQKLGSNANKTVKDEALLNLPGQIQTILSFRKLDNSFSEHPMMGSHRSTVNVLDALTKVQHLLSVDPELIQSTKHWIQLRQEDVGSFLPLQGDMNQHTNNSQDIYSLEHVVDITAETMIVLFDIGIENDVDADTLDKAKIFLENQMHKVNSSQNIAIVSLALVLARSVKAPEAVERLRNASTSDNGEFGWPNLVPKKDAADWLFEAEAGKKLKEPLVATVEEYKASIYALSTFCHIGDLKFAESIARYLVYRAHMLDKHNELIFAAVKAFSQYDTLVQNKLRSLTISLATSGMEMTDTLELKPDGPITTLHLPSLPTKVFVYATGAGCATVQGKTSYSTYTAKNKNSLLEIASSVIQEIVPDRSSVEEIEGKLPMLKIKTCFNWMQKSPSGVLRMDVSLFSGFELTSTPPVINDQKENMIEMQYGFDENNIWFIFANISSTSPICVQYFARSTFVISSLRPSYVRIYPANRADLGVEIFFHSKSGSSLLKDIAEDDLITWFGNKNASEDIYKNETVTETTIVDDMSTPLTGRNIDDLRVEMDEEERNNITFEQKANDDLFLIEPTVTIENETVDINTTIDVNATVEATKMQAKDEIILQANLKPTIGVIINNVSNSKLYKYIEKKPQSVKIGKQEKFVKVKLLKDISMKPQITFEQTTKVAMIELKKVVSEKVHDQLVVDLNVSSPKHVNKEKHNLPENYLENRITNDDKDEDTTSSFPPDNKNDKYINFVKNDLWGMLREVVTGQNDKYPNTNKLDAPK